MELKGFKLQPTPAPYSPEAKPDVVTKPAAKEVHAPKKVEAKVEVKVETPVVKEVAKETPKEPATDK